MTKEQMNRIKNEIYSVASCMKGTDYETKEANMTYLAGIETVLEILGYKFIYNEPFVSIEKL